MLLPVGTTGQRPTGVAGMVRYNSTVPGLEAYYSGAWNALTAGGSAATITLGTSASVTNPQRSGDATTGFYSGGGGGGRGGGRGGRGGGEGEEGEGGGRGGKGGGGGGGGPL